MLLYLRRCADIFIASIICSLPAFAAAFGMISWQSDAYIKLQLIFFCFFIFRFILLQKKVYFFDKRKLYYRTVSLVGMIPYTVLSLVCYFAVPVKIYSLVFLPTLFLQVTGSAGIASILIVNLVMYVLVFIYPFMRRALKGR